MHLAEVLSLRPVPGAAVFLELTRRCPLHCAHCGSRSTMASPENAAELFTRFTDSFTPQDHPRLVLMTGGEPLIRPALVQEIGQRCAELGTSTFLLTGMFFARRGLIPPAIARALEPIDHVSASLDVFHEREVPRAHVFAALDQLLGDGKHVSLHLVGEREGDPYLEDLIEDVRATFGDAVPMLVNTLRSVGRAAEWMGPDAVDAPPADPVPQPCAMAAWPVVSAEGRIVACCNQQVIEGPVPRHLLLGDAACDGWPAVRDRSIASPALRALRTLGPIVLQAQLHGGIPVRCDGYCDACRSLGDEPSLGELCESLFGQPGMSLVETEIVRMRHDAGAVTFARHHGAPAYAELVALGAPDSPREAVTEGVP